MTEDTIW